MFFKWILNSIVRRALRPSFLVLLVIVPLALITVGPLVLMYVAQGILGGHVLSLLLGAAILVALFFWTSKAKRGKKAKRETKPQPVRA